MKRFIKKLIVLSTLVILSFLMLGLFQYFVVGNQYKYSYNASIIDKIHRLESISEPKILLIGNSNVAFGFFSEEIEREFGMPVVNLGLHGGMGNAFHENMIKFGLNKGDIVVICHTTYSDEDNIPNKPLAWLTYDQNSEVLKLIRPKDYVGIIVAYPEHIRKVFSLWIKGNGNLASGDCYSRKAFNEHGDIVYRPKGGGWKDDKNFKKYKPFNKNINHTCVDRLNELNEYCQEKGASLVVAGYPIAYGEYSDFSVDDVENFQIELRKQLNCDVISDYKAYMLPYKYFYNSVWHLNDEGAEIRTRMLISDLKIWMQNRE